MTHHTASQAAEQNIKVATTQQNSRYTKNESIALGKKNGN